PLTPLYKRGDFFQNDWANTTMTSISVIIVSYNTREILLNCLRSVYSSTGDVELEVFVVDNASRDGTVDAIRGEFPQCTVVTLEKVTNLLGDDPSILEH